MELTGKVFKWKLSVVANKK